MLLSEWTKVISDTSHPRHRHDIDTWVVTSIVHQKSFFFSVSVHEYIQVEIKQRMPLGKSNRTHPPAKSHLLYVERMKAGDYITTEWKSVQPCPVSPSASWISKLQRGNFEDVDKLIRSVTDPEGTWEALGFTSAAKLCSLEFKEPRIPLRDFAKVLDGCSRERPAYQLLRANCYWFSSAVYANLKEKWVCREELFPAYPFKGKIAGLSVMEWRLVFWPLSICEYAVKHINHQ